MTFFAYCQSIRTLSLQTIERLSQLPEDRSKSRSTFHDNSSLTFYLAFLYHYFLLYSYFIILSSLPLSGNYLPPPKEVGTPPRPKTPRGVSTPSHVEDP